MKRVMNGTEWFRRVLCMMGFHKWSENYGGVRVCLRRGCMAIDMYFGLTGMLRYLRERHAQEEIQEMAKRNNETITFPLLNKLMQFMMVFVVSGMLTFVAWTIIEQVYGDIENPAGAVIRLGMMAVFSILVWRMLPKKMRHLDLMNLPRSQRRQ